VAYDAWLTQQELRDGSLPSLGEWDWEAIETLVPPGPEKPM
jgi:hypothetical protein